MSCTLVRLLLERLVQLKDVYSGDDVDDTFFHFYDLADTDSTDIPFVADKVVLILELLRKNKPRWPKIIREQIRLVADVIYDLHFHRTINHHQRSRYCDRNIISLSGEPPECAEWCKLLTPLLNGKYRGTITHAYNRLIKAVELMVPYTDESDYHSV